MLHYMSNTCIIVNMLVVTCQGILWDQRASTSNWARRGPRGFLKKRSVSSSYPEKGLGGKAIQVGKDNGEEGIVDLCLKVGTRWDFHQFLPYPVIQASATWPHTMARGFRQALRASCDRAPLLVLIFKRHIHLTRIQG